MPSKPTLVKRGILVIALILCLVLVVWAFLTGGAKDASVWTTTAAALAVVTAIISAWTSQDVLELQRQAQQPYPYPSLDVASRYGLMQLKVTNYGRTAAHQVSLRWDKPLLNPAGEPVTFCKEGHATEIPVLLPNETVSILVGGNHHMFQKYTELDFSGTVAFVDPSGKKRCHPFQLSAEKYRHGLTYDEEEPRTHFELQRIPKALEEICRELKKLSDAR